MGRLDVIPSNIQRLPVFGLAVFSILWLDINRHIYMLVFRTHKITLFAVLRFLCALVSCHVLTSDRLSRIGIVAKDSLRFA